MQCGEPPEQQGPEKGQQRIPETEDDHGNGDPPLSAGHGFFPSRSIGKGQVGTGKTGEKAADKERKVAEALQRRGWSMKALDEYDEQYYRQWAHELPPMTHAERETEVDIHHSILPVTCRLQQLRGVGPLVATALVAAVGDGSHFRKGRQMAAAIGTRL